jgi:electron-transferring-flavoprotein dehydrogenase
LQDSPFSKVFGGSFIYHMKPNKVLIGMVVGLDYENPYLNPYREFQRFKHHPEVAKHLKGGTCVAYGARVLNEGGYHAIPKLTFPGGLLIGCSAGFLNAMKIKGSHTAMKSGMLAAEAVFNKVTDENTTLPFEVPEYETNLFNSWVGKELRQVRNAHGAFRGPLGAIGGLMHAGFTLFITKGSEPWTFHNNSPDWTFTKPADQCKEINYPKPDGKLSFDLLTNHQRSGKGVFLSCCLLRSYMVYCRYRSRRRPASSFASQKASGRCSNQYVQLFSLPNRILIPTLHRDFDQEVRGTGAKILSCRRL